MTENFYIHIPFCRQKCSYCNFATIENGDNKIHEKYFSVLKKEIEKYFLENPVNKIKTIYFGGGTPSAVDEKYIGEIIKLILSFTCHSREGGNPGGNNSIKIFNSNKNGNISLDGLKFMPGTGTTARNDNNSENIEILMESNPEDLSEKKLENLKKLGVTKISIGIQSFQEKFFDFFERKNYEAEKIILNAKKFFPNLSIDLIFGIPNQSLEDLKKDLEIVKKLDLKHISYYALDYKKNSKIQNKKEDGLDFGTVKKYYFEILDFLENENFEQYEFYNFCKNLENGEKKFGSEKNFNWHNKNFWELENYIGFGLSAVGSNGKKNFINTKNLKKYLDSNGEKKFFQEEEKFFGYEKNFLELQKIFHLTRWKKNSEIEKILGIKNLDKKNILEKNSKIKTKDLNNSEKILEKILNSNFIEKNFSQNGEKFLKLNREGIMHFEDFFEEIFS